MDLQKEIKEIRAALERIEQALAGHSKASRQAKSKVGKKPAEIGENADFSGPAGGLRLLLSKGYFKQRRQFADVMQTLKADGYLYRKQAFHNALTRMSKLGGPLIFIKEGGKKVYAERK